MKQEFYAGNVNSLWKLVPDKGASSQNVVSMSGIPGLEQGVCLCGGTEGGRAKLGPDNHGIHSLKIILFYF